MTESPKPIRTMTAERFEAIKDSRKNIAALKDYVIDRFAEYKALSPYPLEVKSLNGVTSTFDVTEASLFGDDDNIIVVQHKYGDRTKDGIIEHRFPRQFLFGTSKQMTAEYAEYQRLRDLFAAA